MRAPHLLALVAVAALAVSACSDGGEVTTTDVPTSAPSSSTSGAPTSSTPAPTSPSTASTEVPPAATAAEPRPATATVATYWTRPYGDGRPVQLPFYADPADGPKPYLLYGSITNTGSGPIDGPTVVVTWRDTAGAVVHTASAPAIDPLGEPLASLAVGETADVLVAVTDPMAAPRLDALTAETSAWSR